ncbi:MAG: transmembrane ion channel [Spirochaetae bacterium HGW-Spirochaetae-1]|jgi:small-conductance mechanosensitive channel|nr:MAG: transmembrane ion channel [Spirochaetae bacterium HGW-Spirochaetae-1]
MKKLPIIILVIAFSSMLYAQENTITPYIDNKQIDIDSIPKGEPVIVGDKELFRIHSVLGPFSSKERASATIQRLNRILEKKLFDRDKLKVITSEFTTDIVYDNAIIMSITAIDAKEENKNPDELANAYIETIADIQKTRPQHTIVNKPEDIYTFIINNRDTLIKAVVALFSSIVFLIIYYFLSKLFSKIYTVVEKRKGTTFKSIIIKNNEIISDSTLVSLLVSILKAVKLSAVIGLLYLLITIIFILFPWAKSASVMNIIKGILLTILTTVIAIGIFKTIKIGMKALQDNISNWKGTLIKPLKIKTVSVLTEEQSVNILKKMILAFYIILNIFLLYIFIPIIFSYFEFTSTWADSLFGYILTPLKMMISAFAGFLPNLFFIFVIIFVNRYVIKLTKVIFDEIAAGNIAIHNFHQDWAEPTFKIVRSMIIIFTIIVVFPYLPGSQSDAFKGISIFLGILFSLGSTSVIANIVAGTILTYMYAFRIGDRVKIGDTVGDVIEKTLLVTRVKTVKNIMVTIPNSIVMGSHIINYTTSSTHGEGLILCTTITLGYDIPWKKVHDTLINAALATADIKKQPSPFVLQTGLDDFYVSYEVNCYTDRPEIMARIYSELHQNIQDKCSEAGIEILSPHYTAARDGNASTIPGQSLQETYQAPPFVIKIIDKLIKKDKNGDDK